MLPSSYCRELDLLAKIDRFGIKAILGRDVFYYGELRRLILAENIRDAYRARAKSENWVTWSTSNPIMAKILVDIEKDLQ